MKPAGAYGGNHFIVAIMDTRRSPARQYCHIFKNKKKLSFFFLDMLIYCRKYVFLDKKSPCLKEDQEEQGLEEGYKLPCLPPSEQQRI